MAERRLLDKICADFTAVYYVELNTGSFEILHINDGTNAKKMNLKQGDNFNSSADQYAVQYLHEKERQEFKDWISTGHLPSYKAAGCGKNDHCLKTMHGR